MVGMAACKKIVKNFRVHSPTLPPPHAPLLLLLLQLLLRRASDMALEFKGNGRPCNDRSMLMGAQGTK